MNPGSTTSQLSETNKSPDFTQPQFFNHRNGDNNNVHLISFREGLNSYKIKTTLSPLLLSASGRIFTPGWQIMAPTISLCDSQRSFREKSTSFQRESAEALKIILIHHSWIICPLLQQNMGLAPHEQPGQRIKNSRKKIAIIK